MRLVKLVGFMGMVMGQCFNSNSTFSRNIYTENFEGDYNTDHITQQNGILGLRLDNSGGTRISSKSDILYGEITARIKIPMGSNVVSSFILMAENGDEIDFEFVGKDSNIIQTNYFYRGEQLFNVNARMYATKNLALSYNTFTIEWTEEYYKWKYNGMTLRTLYKNETSKYPETISKVQFGIWNATSSSWAGPGINWAGAPYNYYIDYISINCKDPFTTTTIKSETTRSSTSTARSSTSTTRSSTSTTRSSTSTAKSSSTQTTRSTTTQTTTRTEIMTSTIASETTTSKGERNSIWIFYIILGTVMLYQ